MKDLLDAVVTFTYLPVEKLGMRNIYEKFNEHYREYRKIERIPALYG